MSSRHPLDPLSADEIESACSVVRTHAVEKQHLVAIKFVAAFVKHPSKSDVIAYMKSATPTALPRKAEVHVIDMITGLTSVAITLLGSDVSVESFTATKSGEQPCMTLEELCAAEEALRKDPKVLARISKMGIKAEQLYCDGWTIGYDDRFPPERRLQQCMTYARFSEDSNLYAHPLDFYPVLDSNTFEVLAIDVPRRRDADGRFSTERKGIPALGDEADIGSDNITKPPLKRYEYLPQFLAEDGIKQRTDMKPLVITQPEGVSFTLDGNVLEWQRWKLHIGFHYREGLVLSTVSYNDAGNVRPVFYRMSLAEMVVPYADPEWPHPRKFAFDIGEYGLGVLANELALGCDCKGVIQYLPGSFVDHAGKAVTIKNAICIHEEDAGLLYKHTDYRPGGKAHSVRSRRLVISMICTVANYEYAIYWNVSWCYHNFYQDGSISLEVKLTGILNLSLLAPGESTGGYGTEVAPQVNAQYHQHLFSLRLDPMVDGMSNSVLQTDIIPSKYPTGSSENFAGNAFTIEKTILHQSGGTSSDASKQRYWTFINENKKHYATKQPVGFKMMTKDTPPLLCQPDSWVAKRAAFATKTLWTVPYEEDQLYPAGKWVPQTRVTPEDSVVRWAEGKKNIRDTDLVAYVTIGVTHIPRPEDYPVMPQETCTVMFKPVGFFDQNPALDVPTGVDQHSEYATAGRASKACHNH